MSREAPRFGEVFRWKSESQEALIMYIAPVAARAAPWDNDWLGVTLDESDVHLAGDVDRRITLSYHGWSALVYHGWSEVTDD